MHPRIVSSRKYFGRHGLPESEREIPVFVPIGGQFVSGDVWDRNPTGIDVPSCARCFT